jgi:hypothetical protein
MNDVLPARVRREEIYLRPSASRDDLPPGWQTHAAGAVDGVRLDFVYRPDRHDVCRAIGRASEELVAGLREAGYHRVAALDDGVELWVRDRPASVRGRLAGFRMLDGGRARQR